MAKDEEKKLHLVKDAQKLTEDNDKNTNPNKAAGFEVDKYDNLRNTSVKNATLLIKQDPKLKDIFKFNEFTQENDVVENVQLKSSFGILEIKRGMVSDQILDTVELYFEDKYQVIFKNSLIDQAISNVSHLNSYNPVKEYIIKCYEKWDHKRRIDNFFPTYLGVDKNETTILISRQFFMGVIAKILNPGIKYDSVLDLVGGQGVGKTSCFQKIAPCGYYTDQFNNFKDKDQFEVMKNALIVNDDEMTATNNASFAELKKFITMQEFEYRKAFARKLSRFKKKFVLVRTTNEQYYLKDKSGDRRFNALWCDARKQKKSPVTDLDQETVDQLWGEAYWLYANAKDPFLLTEDQQQLLEDNRQHFIYTTGLENELRDVLDNNFADKDFISNRELSEHLFRDPDALSHNNKDSKDVRYYMGHLGYNVGVQRKIDGENKRGFEKKK